jgi:hypothetical protein
MVNSEEFYPRGNIFGIWYETEWPKVGMNIVVIVQKNYSCQESDTSPSVYGYF